MTKGIVIALPIGNIGVTFKEGDVIQVETVEDNSPIHKEFINNHKEEYTVCGLNIPDEIDLTGNISFPVFMEILQLFENSPNRMLTVSSNRKKVQNTPFLSNVSIPAGPLQIKFDGAKRRSRRKNADSAKLSSVLPTSPLVNKVKVGNEIISLIIPGISEPLSGRGVNGQTMTQALQDSRNVEGRVLVIAHSDLSKGSMCGGSGQNGSSDFFGILFGLVICTACAEYVCDQC